jgi:hypothetical protein
MKPEKTKEEKARSKRIHALVMIILGAIMSVCALSAGLIAMHPGVFPSWLTGGWLRAETPTYRTPAAIRVKFIEYSPLVQLRAKGKNQLILLHLSPSWSREARLMEEQVYADSKAAQWIADNLVAAVADVEERPELAHRYGVGAWPTTALLLPDGRAVAAASRLTPKLFLPWAGLIASKLKAEPAKAEGLVADAQRRVAAVRSRPAPRLGPDDPVWGGVYRGPPEYAKVLADQAAVVLSSDVVRAQAVLGFVERFMTLPGGGYAASVRGEVELADGRIEEGASYFAKDDAERRAAGLPAVDRRVFAASNADMARAVLRSRVSTAPQRDHARRTLDFLWTRLVKDGRVSRMAGGLSGWPPDQWAVIEAEMAADGRDRARKVFARQDTEALRALGPNVYVDTLRKRLK